MGQLKWSFLYSHKFTTQLNFSRRTDQGFLYKYCYLGHNSICLVKLWIHCHRYIVTNGSHYECEPHPWRHHNLVFTTSPHNEILHAHRLDTDLTKQLARCLRIRDGHWATLSMTGTQAIANCRQNSLHEATLPVFTACTPHAWLTTISFVSQIKKIILIITDRFSNNAVHSSQLFTVDLLLDQSLCAVFRGWCHNNNFFIWFSLLLCPSDLVSGTKLTSTCFISFTINSHPQKIKLKILK